MSSIEDLPDVLLYKIFTHCTLIDRLISVELVSDRWRRLAIHADSISDGSLLQKSLNTKDFERATVAYQFVFQNASNEQKFPPATESNDFLMKLFSHVLPQIGNNLTNVKLALEIVPLNQQTNSEADMDSDLATPGFPVATRVVHLLLQHCPKLEDIDFGPTYIDEQTAQLLLRFPKLQGIIIKTTGENCETYMPDITAQLKLRCLGTAQGAITCVDPSKLRVLKIFNSWHREFESVKSQLHIKFPNLEEIVRGRSRVYPDNTSSNSIDGEGGSDDDDRKYLQSVCKLKHLKRFDDTSAVVPSDEDLSRLVRSCPHLHSLKLAASFEGNLKTVLDANWSHRFRGLCICDIKIDLACLRTIFGIGTLEILRLNAFVANDILEETERISERGQGNERNLIGKCLANLKRLFLNVRGNEIKHDWANRLVIELLQTDHIRLKSFVGQFICSQKLLAAFGACALERRSSCMDEIRLKITIPNLHPIFDQNKIWPNLQRLHIIFAQCPTCTVGCAGTSVCLQRPGFTLKSHSLRLLEPLLHSNVPQLTHFTTKLEVRNDQQPNSSSEEYSLENIIVAWPNLRSWQTIDVLQEEEAYELIRCAAAHPTLERISINALFAKWDVNSVARAIRRGRDILHVRYGRRMHVLTLILLCNGRQILNQSETGLSERGPPNLGIFHGCWELHRVYVI